jgi:hypothetical protein
MYQISEFVSLTSATGHYSRFANQGGSLSTLRLNEVTTQPEFECGCGARNCGCDSWLDDLRTSAEQMRSSTRGRIA